MHRTLRRPVAGLALALSLGSASVYARPTTSVIPSLTQSTPQAAPVLSESQLAFQKSQQPQRITRAHDTLRGLRKQLGLGASDGFATSNAFTNTQGQAIVWVDQTHAGSRVWGGRAVVHVLPDGSVRSLTQALQRDVRVQGEPALTAEQASAIAVRQLAPTGPMKDAPRVERVVFPTRFAAVDPQTGRSALDRQSYEHPERPAAYVWAYEVHARVKNVQDGLKQRTYVIDARTGLVLHERDALAYQAAPPAEPTPVKGTGLGYYRGAVSLDTTQMPDGTFALWDTTRGSLPNQALQWTSQGDGTSWSPTGMQVWYGENDAQGFYTWRDWVYRSPTNAWGDGAVFTEWGNEGGANGQSAGVDALSSMATTWDLFKNVFGRDGLDGAGTTLWAQVLLTPSWLVGQAAWDRWQNGLYLGAATYPANPNGVDSMTDLDVIAHEMTHGVIAFTSNLYNGNDFEEAGLHEASADFFAQMAEAYASRGPSFPANAIPPTGSDWTQGSGPYRGTPLRWMIKPSKDQRSPDAWYDGVRYLWGHYSSGPMSRALYFLANGASSTPGEENYSPHLPTGMVGIGNDATARIWFKTITERLVSDGTASLKFEDARREAIAVAEELNGVGSAQVNAVKSAFAAINVGEAPGQSPRTQVLFANWRNGDYTQADHPDGRFDNVQYLPKGETVVPRITVRNNADTRVTWSVGGPSMFNGAGWSVAEGGRINADGSWTTPNQMSWHALTATSVAEPTQYAEGRAFLVNMDTDTDTEQDALDMGGIAASWYLANGLDLNHSTLMAPFVDDDDVGIFVDAMRSTWPVK